MRMYTETPFRMVPYRGVAIAPDWDRPAPRPPETDLLAMRVRLAEAIDTEIHRMLGLWVSECEPALCWGPEGLLGLGLAGDPGPARIYVRSRLATLEACMAVLSAGPGAA